MLGNWDKTEGIKLIKNDHADRIEVPAPTHHKRNDEGEEFLQAALVERRDEKAMPNSGPFSFSLEASSTCPPTMGH